MAGCSSGRRLGHTAGRLSSVSIAQILHCMLEFARPSAVHRQYGPPGAGRLRDQLRSRLHRWSAQMDLAIKTLRYNALLE
jgi:hypothetical protein